MIMSLFNFNILEEKVFFQTSKIVKYCCIHFIVVVEGSQVDEEEDIRHILKTLFALIQYP